MSLDTESWEKFILKDLFTLKGGFYNKKPYHSTNGNIPFLASTDSNNGVTEYYSIEDIQSWNKTGEEDSTIDKKIYPGNCITVTVNGSVCNAYYQESEFTCSHDITVLYGHNFKLNKSLAMFFCTIISNEKYRWSYGRKPHDKKKFGNSIIKLPILKDEVGAPVIDQKKKFSSNGFVPDFDYIEKFIESLHHEYLKTNVVCQNDFRLDTDSWKNFYLHRIFNTSMGNGINAVTTTNYNPKYNYVSRNSNDNGVVDFVDEIEGEAPFPAGALTLALGGSYLGSCFVQDKPFYTAQNVGILQEKVSMSIYSKLFIATLIRNECKTKYLAFGRELNSHFRKDFSIKLPVRHDGKEIFIDKTKEFSDDGYVPDWDQMEQLMKKLSYSDRII